MALSESFHWKNIKKVSHGWMVKFSCQLNCDISSVWLQIGTKSDKLIHPWIVEEAQVVVKIESESEKIISKFTRE